MILLDAVSAARRAVRNHPDRPATAILHDSDDARIVVFNLAPGQSVPAHTSASTVQLTVLAGSGHLVGESDGHATTRPCTLGEMAVFAPHEPHGMRADDDQELLLLATITPRPGAR